MCIFKRRREAKRAEFKEWADQRYQEFLKNRELRETFERRREAARIERLCDQAWDGVRILEPPLFFVDSTGVPHLEPSQQD